MHFHLPVTHPITHTPGPSSHVLGSRCGTCTQVCPTGPTLRPEATPTSSPLPRRPERCFHLGSDLARPVHCNLNG